MTAEEKPVPLQKKKNNGWVPWVVVPVAFVLMLSMMSSPKTAPSTKIAAATSTPKAAAVSVTSTASPANTPVQSTSTAVPTVASIPTPIPVTYTVKGGDTLGAIAAEYGVTWLEIAAANDIDDPAKIRPGQELVIPGGSAAAVNQPTAGESAQPEATPVQTRAPTKQATLDNLPGLTPVDVKLSLINQLGFECGHVDHGKMYYVWVCQKSATTASYDVLLYVEIYGKTLSTVNFIDSSVLQNNVPDDELAASILGFIATMPYDNADPSAARQWVHDQIVDVGQENSERSAVISGVPFHFYGPPSARMLEIGTPQ